MIEDSVTMEGESAIPLDGIAVGVDHLEALVVFLLSAVHTYATWVHPQRSLSGSTIATVAREAYLAGMQASAKIDPEAHQRREAAPKPSYPVVTIDDPDHLTVVHRIRSFGVAIMFEREVPLGLARAFTQKIISTLEHDLPYVGEPRSVLVHSAAPYEPPIVVPSSSPVAARSSSTSAMPRVVGPPASDSMGIAAAITDAMTIAPDGLARPERVTMPPLMISEPRSGDPEASDGAPHAVQRSSLATSTSDRAPFAASPSYAPEPRIAEPTASASVAPAKIASALPPPPKLVETPKPPMVTMPSPTIDDRAPDSPHDPFNGPDTIARPRMAPTLADVAPPEEDAAPSSIGSRARRLLALLQERSVEAHIMLVRVGLRTGLGLEPLLDPKNLNAEAIMLIETAAEDMLGLDHEGLQAALAARVEGSAP